MPEDKVEVIKRVYDAFNRGEFDAAVANADVWTLGDDGHVTRMEVFLDHHRDEALEAAGLAE